MGNLEISKKHAGQHTKFHHWMHVWDPFLHFTSKKTSFFWKKKLDRVIHPETNIFAPEIGDFELGNHHFFGAFAVSFTQEIKQKRVEPGNSASAPNNTIYQENSVNGF